jgi:hypothetical protein
MHRLAIGTPERENHSTVSVGPLGASHIVSMVNAIDEGLDDPITMHLTAPWRSLPDAFQGVFTDNNGSEAGLDTPLIVHAGRRLDMPWSQSCNGSLSPTINQGHLHWYMLTLHRRADQSAILFGWPMAYQGNDRIDPRSRSRVKDRWRYDAPQVAVRLRGPYDVSHTLIVRNIT